jgi:threonine aldolase
MPSPTHPTVDLRSDTLTRPTEAMRRAMASADVGDDVYGEDPSAAALEARSAELLGKEAALFVPSGTMANQIALLLHCRPGDEVVVGRGAHLFYYEGGAGGAWAGVQFLEVGTTGLFTAEDVRAAVKPLAYWLPRTRAVAVENTHNRSGGRVFPEADFAAIAEAARSKGLALHVDGARIWNAAVATGKTPAELTKHADTVSACFSKGLGAPVGSVIAGTGAHIDEARRFRRMLGGAMRQVGVLCAAATYAHPASHPAPRRGPRQRQGPGQGPRGRARAPRRAQPCRDQHREHRPPRHRRGFRRCPPQSRGRAAQRHRPATPPRRHPPRRHRR